MIETSICYWRKKVFAVLWITYGSFYLCRVNFSIAIPGIMKEFGYSKFTVGLIGSALFISYGIGLFINGQLGDKFGARKLISLGIFSSAILNVVFGFSTTLIAMATIWGLNGYFQSMGWPLSIKTLANWFPLKGRGRVSGLFGSSFQFGNVISWLLAGWLCSHYGWRYAFWGPALLFVICGVFFFRKCRNSPEDIGFPSIEEFERRKQFFPKNETRHNENNEWNATRDEHLGFRFTIRQTIGNRKMWMVGWSYLFLGFVNYGILFWIPTYMFEIQGVSIANAAVKSIIFPLSGSLGALLVGWATDKFCGSRRIPLVIVMSILAGIFLLIYPNLPSRNNLLTLLCMGSIGFSAFGAQTIMVTAIPMDFGTRKAAASAAGFIDSLGYVGAIIAGVGVGWLIDSLGWDFAFYFWTAAAFIACIPILPLWKYVPSEGRYI